VPEDKQPESNNPWVAVARYSELGFIIPAAVFLGFLLGKLLDYLLHTTWIYIAESSLEPFSGFVEMIRMATASFKDKS
jgi:hypothetical protein